MDARASGAVGDVCASYRDERAMLVEAACREFSVEASELGGRARRPEVGFARTLAAMGLRHEFGMSWPEIGRALHVDHTTAMLAYRRHFENQVWWAEIVDRVFAGVVTPTKRASEPHQLAAVG